MPGSTRHHAGFTLIEVTAVLLIMGLMAGLAGVSLRGALDKATLDDVAQQFASVDHNARQRAVRSGVPVQLRFDLDDQTLQWQHGNADATPAMSWPKRYTVELVPNNDTITINESGRSPSYLVRITDAHEQSLWVYVCGLTGENGVFSDAESVADIQAIAAQKRLP